MMESFTERCSSCPKWMKKNKQSILKYTCLIIGCLAMANAGSTFAINAYANGLKDEYNLTQTQVSLILSVNNIGISLGAPAGYLNERAGVKATIVVGFILVEVPWILLWHSTLIPQFYAKHVTLLYIYFFLFAVGFMFSYIPSMVVNLSNFKSVHRGKVMGMLDSALSLGPAIAAAIYTNYFMFGSKEGGYIFNLNGIFLFQILVSVVVYVLCFIFLRYMPISDDEISEDTILVDKNDLIEDTTGVDSSIDIAKEFTENQKDTNPDLCEESDSMCFLDMIKNMEFDILFLCYVCNISIQFVFITNLAVYLRSFYLENYVGAVTIFFPTVGVLAKFSIGWLSDLIVHKQPRVLIIFVSTVVQTFFFIFCIFYADNISFFISTLVVIAIANGAIWCLFPVIISEYFGMKYFGSNWGWTLLGNGIFGIFAQLIFGALYDAQIDEENETNCYGLHCFKWSFLFFIISSGIASVFSGYLLVYRLRKREKQMKYFKT